MNESIRQLLTLQERDLILDRLQSELTSIPAKVEALKKEIQTHKAELENAKKEMTQLQLVKKSREVDLETQEGVIRKHTTELNSVKSNDAYKALLGEIDKAKKDKSALEDQILQVMEQMDQATRTWKEKEAAAKTQESDFLRQISDWEAKQKNLEEQIQLKKTEREQATGTLPKGLYGQYQRLREGGRGAAVVPLRSEQCSGCHMKVSQNLINEVRRGQKLMTCESCSRIVYLEEVATA
jgi:predicted  nucleic acid-binding Zn-ribbon protein